MNLQPMKAWLFANAQPILAQRFSESRVNKILDGALARYESEAPSLPSEAAIGGRLMVHCAALTAAVYRELLDEGQGEADAREVTAKVTAAIYDKMANVTWLVARISARSPVTRLKRATNAFRRFPFSEPAYQTEDVVADEQTVAFDVKRCPVAEYFCEQGLKELCVESFCNLDFALAEKWGAHLERTTTLAAGDDRCDFRWHVMPTGKDEGPVTAERNANTSQWMVSSRADRRNS